MRTARSLVYLASAGVAAALLASWPAAARPGAAKPAPLRVTPPHISTDRSVKYDFDIVYVRAPRKHPRGAARWAEAGDPRRTEPGADLVLLRPDGTERVLVAAGRKEALADPAVSFDAQWVYYSKFHDAEEPRGADIYKVHVKTQKVVRLTHQGFTPNTGAAHWTKQALPRWGAFNLGPCPVPGGKVVFVSDRNVYRTVHRGHVPNALALQLFVMDDDGGNVECIGHFNLGMALHPVVLKDGRVMFSTLESQGLRSHHLWGLWSIHPDGTNWGPLFSAFEPGNGTADSTHFQAQLSDGSLVVLSYYFIHNFGFGTYFKFPVSPPPGEPAFGPGLTSDPRNPQLRLGRHPDGRPKFKAYPFSPYGLEALTPFVGKGDWPAELSDLSDARSPRVGKFTHPSGAPDGHLLTVWSPGSVRDLAKLNSSLDSGLYLIKGGKPIAEPGQMLLIKNDPKYHEQWPRALVPYRRIYGVDEPRRLAPVANDGQLSKHLPEGAPFGLVGSSSLYKRETYPYGQVKPGGVVATFAGAKDPTGHRGFDSSFNWTVQGAEAGLYASSDIHAVRILQLEPTSETRERRFYNLAEERMRILGEVPVRKFAGGKEPLDPDGNPDTSFLAKIPADVAWTFQTLDKDGMVLNSSQTWHQLRPGEVRTDCGGCHAHSQRPTPFEKTAAAAKDYKVWDLVSHTPLLTGKKLDETGQKWDAAGESGVRFHKGMKTVEYHRDIKPIFARSCVACHTHKGGRPAAGLALDDDKMVTANTAPGLSFQIELPATYARLAADRLGKLGDPKPLARTGWPGESASRYVWAMQARRSLLIWKVYGRRLDGWQNDDLQYEAVPGDPTSLRHKGRPVEATPRARQLAHIGYVGGAMPPAEAVAGTWKGPDGKAVKVAALSDEDRRALVRWVDLGCPIDLAYDPSDPKKRGNGWMLDDNRPTLTLTEPRPGRNDRVGRILVGMYDGYTGLDLAGFEVFADFAVNGTPAGRDLARQFRVRSPGVWELKLKAPITKLAAGYLTVRARDGQGNLARIDRTFSVGKGR